VEPEKTDGIVAADQIVAVQEAEKIKESEHEIVLRAIEVAASIKDQSTYDEAVDLRKKLKDAVGRIADRMNPTKDRLHKAHRDFCDLIAEMQKPFTDALAKMEPVMRDFARAEEKRRQDKIEADRKEAEDRRLRDAQVLADAGKEEKAMEILNRSIKPAPKPAAFKKGGIRTKTDWEITIVDPQALISAVTTGKCPSWYLQPDTKRILQDVRSKMGKITIPGVSITEV
jgi:hypothetical protein